MSEVAETFSRHAIESARSIALDNIERKATAVAHDASMMALYISLLASLPEYETNAEEAVEKARKALEEALGKVTEAEAAMKSKRQQRGLSDAT